MNVGSLFSGVGGFDLGLERAGMRVVWQCEQDAYCRRVLAKRWPGVPCYPDVRALVADAENERGSLKRAVNHAGRSLVGTVARSGGGTGGGPTAPGSGVSGGIEFTGSEGDVRSPLPVSVPYVDVLCGGFPCQDLSYAGKGTGIDGSRSGLWREFARLVGELRPRYVIVENVPALASRGLDRVLADLAACGFDAEWDHLPASAFGAPHRRDRLWLVAYPNADDRGRARIGEPQPSGIEGSCRGVADGLRADGEQFDAAASSADPECAGLEGHGADAGQPQIAESRDGGALADAGGEWAVEPDVGRVAYGIPARVDRLRALGNALVPQIAEWIGRRIVSWES